MFRSMSKSATVRRQRGLAMVETAVAMPVLLLLLVAVGDLGHALYQYNILERTVRDATRYLADAAICDASGVIKINECNARTPTINLAVYGAPVSRGNPLLPGLAAGDVAIQELPAGAVTKTHVRVVITYNFDAFFPVIPVFGTENNISLPTQFIVGFTMRAT